jgi:cell division protein FtsW
VSASARARVGSASGSRRDARFAWLDSPVTTYYLFAGVSAALVVFGLIMVLSASSIVSLDQTSSPYSIFGNQVVFALVGAVALVIASRLSVRTWRRSALVILLLGLVLQGLVFSPLGVSVQGNTNWIDVGPFVVQPSEVMKVGLALSGGLILAIKHRHLGSFSHVVVPYLVPVVAVSIGLVALGRDLGTALVLAAVVGGALFGAGVPMRWFVLAVIPAAGAVTAFVLTSPNRLGRFDVWLGRDTDVFGAARQTIHGEFALADGGWLGLGLGASREKWGLLPAPHNDFIFAIIGEELGLPGTLAVLLLFVAFAFACYRLVARTDDLFVRVVTAGIMSWVVVQAFVNIGSVVGIIPVVGLPLPLVSSGGSSLITTMGAIGILMSFARTEPGCAEALSARPSVMRRTVAVVPSAVRARRRRR